MRTKVALFSVGIVVVALIGLLRGQSPSITFEEVNNRFGVKNKSNELKKNHEWQAYKGQCVMWFGELRQVTDLFSEFSGITLTFRHLSSTFSHDVSVSAPISQKETFMDWEIGKVYPYAARLEDYGGALLPIRARWDWSCAKSVSEEDVDTSIFYHMDNALLEKISQMLNKAEEDFFRLTKEEKESVKRSISMSQLEQVGQQLKQKIKQHWESTNKESKKKSYKQYGMKLEELLKKVEMLKVKLAN